LSKIRIVLFRNKEIKKGIFLLLKYVILDNTSVSFIHFALLTNMENITELHVWLDEYSASHQNPTNILIHEVCVPVIAFTVLGFLWSIPVPKFIRRNVGNLFSHFIPMLVIGPVLAFYFRLSTKMAVIMSAIVLSAFLLLAKMEQKQIRIFRLSLIVFIIGWIGQFIGHGIEGKKPSFAEDLQFLAVGPLWTLASAFRALGIEY
jgi:uncharacterized membrane protein YGL010W